jgi:hypothetical protein
MRQSWWIAVLIAAGSGADAWAGMIVVDVDSAASGRLGGAYWEDVGRQQAVAELVESTTTGEQRPFSEDAIARLVGAVARRPYSFEEARLTADVAELLSSDARSPVVVAATDGERNLFSDDDGERRLLEQSAGGVSFGPARSNERAVLYFGGLCLTVAALLTIVGGRLRRSRRRVRYRGMVETTY